jgi:hypothetical protein
MYNKTLFKKNVGPGTDMWKKNKEWASTIQAMQCNATSMQVSSTHHIYIYFCNPVPLMLRTEQRQLFGDANYVWGQNSYIKMHV